MLLRESRPFLLAAEGGLTLTKLDPKDQEEIAQGEECDELTG